MSGVSGGAAFPLTTTANGRACLVVLGDDQARALAGDEWKRRNLEGDVSELAATLAEAPRTGLAYNLNERTAGISAVAFVFTCAKGDIHAISVPVPTARFVEKRDVIDTDVESAAVDVSTAMPLRHSG